MPHHFNAHLNLSPRKRTKPLSISSHFKRAHKTNRNKNPDAERIYRTVIVNRSITACTSLWTACHAYRAAVLFPGNAAHGDMADRNSSTHNENLQMIPIPT